MLRNFLIFLYCLWCHSFLTNGQDVLFLDFNEAISIGLENNVDVLKANNELTALDATKQEAIMVFLPNLSANVRAARQEGQQFQLVEDGFEISNVQADRLSGGIDAQLSIFEGFSKIHQYSSSELDRRAQQNGVNRSKQVLVFNIAQAYLQILLDKELLSIAQQNVNNQQEQLKRIEGLVEAGIRPQADLFSQRATLKQLELEEIEAKNTYLLDKAGFSSLLQLEPFTVFELQSVENEQLVGSELQSLESLYQTALISRYDLKQQQLITESSNLSIRRTRAAIYPSLFAFYSYGTQFSSLNDLSFRDQLFDLYPNNTVGLSLNIPIFSNFINKAAITRAKVTYNNNELDRQNLRRTIYEEVQNAYLNYTAAQQRVQVSTTAETAAEEAFSIQNERYNEGLANISELAIANQAYYDAQSGKKQAVYAAISQKIILSYQVGTLEFEEM